MNLICCSCKQSKHSDEFPVSRKAKSGHGSKCLLCQREYHKQYYKKNTTETKTRISKHNKRYLIRNRQYIWDYLKTHPCIECNESDPRLLEFDHLNDKTMCVSQMMRTGYAIATINKEIEKCQILCVRCHRLKTASQQNWYQGLG